MIINDPKGGSQYIVCMCVGVREIDAHVRGRIQFICGGCMCGVVFNDNCLRNKRWQLHNW